MMGLIRQLSVNLPRNALLTIYKSFIRPYSDILNDKSGNYNFQNKLEKVQYRACLAIIGGKQGTFKERYIHQLKDVGAVRYVTRHWETLNLTKQDGLKNI